MRIQVESSQDGIVWDEGDKSLRYTRIAAEFEQSDALDGIAELVSQSIREQGTRIEYSTDKGFSYTPLRVNQADPTGRITAANIAGLITRNYKVRYLAVNDKDKGGQQGPSYNNDIMSEASRTKDTPTLYKETAREERIYSKVYLDGSSVKFRSSTTSPQVSSGALAFIENVNVFKMSIPNRTRPIWHKDLGNVTGESLENLPGIYRGHVYDINPSRRSLGTDAVTLEKLFQIPVWKSKHLLEVSSARNFDEESRKLFTGITIATVISGKYNVTWGSYYKFGTRWYIQAKDLAKFASVVHEIGGHVNFPNLLDNDWLIIKECKEADIEEIMKLHGILSAMLTASNNEAELTESLAAAIDYRDDVVDSIITLNEAIKQASNRLAEKKADEVISRLTPPA